jgi:hypothetical protein
VNAAEFELVVRAKSKALPAAAMSKFVRALAIEAGSRIIRRTPVDTGRAKGSWQTTIDQPALADTLRLDKAGAASIAECRSVAARLDPTRFQAIFITSNLPYIRVLEFGEYGTRHGFVRGVGADGTFGVTGTRIRFQRFTRRRVSVKQLKSLERLGVNPAKFVRFRRVKMRKAILHAPKVTPQGFSIQAPRGMVGITLEELRQFANSSAFKVRALQGGAEIAGGAQPL